MGTYETGQRRFDCVRGSDVQRDGMYLELAEGGVAVAEVFYSDVTHTMTLTTFAPDVPLDVIEQLIADAKVRLPPDPERL